MCKAALPQLLHIPSSSPIVFRYFSLQNKTFCILFMVKKAQAQATGGLLEGSGVFECFRHDFKTKSINEWNDHCDDGDHFEMGSTACISCGRVIEFEGHPYVRFKADGSKGLQLQCPDCTSAIKNSATLKMKVVESGK
jgi:hypothetical protein